MDQMQKAFAAEHPEWNITWTTEVVGEDKCQDVAVISKVTKSFFMIFPP